MIEFIIPRDPIPWYNLSPARI